MKKVLLFIVAAVFAGNMNAQTAASRMLVKSGSEIAPSTRVEAVAKAKSNASKVADAAPVATSISKKVKAAPALKVATGVKTVADLCGDYINDYTDNATQITNGFLCGAEKVVVEGVEAISFQGIYNGMAMSAVGYFDPEDMTVTIPACSKINEFNLTTGESVEAWVFAATKPSGQGPFNYELVEIDGEQYYANLVYDVVVGEDGSYYLELRNRGWAVMAVDPTQGEDAILGYLGYSLEGDILYSPNAQASYYYWTVTQAGWSKANQEPGEPVYVENYGSFATIHGIFGMANIDIELDEEARTLTLGNKIAIYSEEIQGVDEKFYWCAFDANDKLTQDESYTSTGVYNPANGYMGFGNLLPNGDIAWHQYALCSEYDPELGAYWICQLGYLEIVPNALLEQDGIESVNVAGKNESKVKYNLAGQRVSDSYKGILVRNGKKFLNK